MRETIFLIETSSDSKLILNGKSRKFLGFEIQWNLMDLLLGTLDFDEIWAKDICLYLDDNSTHGKEFEVETKNF
jgi:hypothetical protein